MEVYARRERGLGGRHFQAFVVHLRDDAIDSVWSAQDRARADVEFRVGEGGSWVPALGSTDEWHYLRGDRVLARIVSYPINPRATATEPLNRWKAIAAEIVRAAHGVAVSFHSLTCESEAEAANARKALNKYFQQAGFAQYSRVRESDGQAVLTIRLTRLPRSPRGG